MAETADKSTIYGIKGVRFLWALFSVFILYATLVPFSPSADFQEVRINLNQISWTPFQDADGSRASIADIVQNILLFLPFGALGILAFYRRRGFILLLHITLLGGLFSCLVECMQLFTSSRTTSTTDIVTNTAGTLAGGALVLLLLSSYLFLQRGKRFQQYRRDKYLALVLMATFVVVAGALQPFDFSISVSAIWAKLKAIRASLFCFNPVLRDEGVVFLRFFLFGFICKLWLTRMHSTGAAGKALMISIVVGVLCEATQLVVRARVPATQDALVVVAGCASGVAIAGPWLKQFRDTVWVNAIVIATALTVAIQILNPFQVTGQYSGFNWFPFLAYYERTTFIALSNFIESLLMFCPLGFILQYFNPLTKRSLLLIGLVSLMIALPLEVLQGWIAGRFADITDVLGAVSGALIAAGMCVLWYHEFVVDRHLVKNNR